MKIVLLLGPSSVGKSTLCEELRASRGWEVLSSDEVMKKIHMGAGDELRKKLIDSGLTAQLLPYMTEDAVVRLCQIGMLTISKGEHLIVDYFVKGPLLPDIEHALNDAGFEQSVIETLSKTLRAVGQVHRDHKFPSLEETLLNEAFLNANEPHKTIIIDTVPGSNPTASAELLMNFNRRADNYRQKNGDESLETYTVLAYLSPEKLSERIQRRNVEADQFNNPKNRRIGLFPFRQMSRLVVATSSASENFTLATLSHQELFKAAYQHNKFIPGVTETSPAILRFKKAGEAAIQYVKLSKNFAMPAMPGNCSNTQVTLTIRDNLHFDAMIDTSGSNPKMLADKLLNELNSLQSSRLHLLNEEGKVEKKSLLRQTSPEQLSKAKEIVQRYKTQIEHEVSVSSAGIETDEKKEEDVAKGPGTS